MSDEEIPRRLRRFHKDELPTQEEVHGRSTEIAIKEVDKFKDTHSRYPQKDELEEISESVFNQLKNELKQDQEYKKEISSQLELEEPKDELENLETDLRSNMNKMSLLEKRKERRHHGHMETEEEESKEKIEETKNKVLKKEKQKIKMPEINDADEMPDLMEENDDLSELESSDEVKKLSSIEELGSLENELEESDDFDLIDKETEITENNCPTCNNKTKEFIYCPNCGNAFCDHCAKKIDVQTDSLEYTCPNCNTAFKKRKKF
ncbi:MAG: hypothetical protein NUV57_02375 [archaeon]|nr:hypothetical protein [archaeon]